MVKCYDLFLNATRIKRICDKAIDNYSHGLEFLRKIRVKKICDKTVDACPFVFNSFIDQCKTQGMCYKVLFKGTFVASIDKRLKKCVIKL